MAFSQWQLNDKEWLLREYVDKCRTQASIVAELECTHTQLTNALKSHGIRVRDVSETKQARGTLRRRSQFPLLNDEAWLRAKYLDEKLSISDITMLIIVDQRHNYADTGQSAPRICAESTKEIQDSNPASA